MAEFQTVGVYEMPPEAHLAKIALERAGVPAFIENENYLDVEGQAWPSDGVRVTVRAEHAEQARSILESGNDDSRTPQS